MTQSQIPFATGSVEMNNAFDSSQTEQLPASIAKLIARRSRVLSPSYRLQYRQPLEFVRGNGVWLYDSSGTAYLDAYNNVPSVGHSHPTVVEAVSRQAALLNTNTRYLDENLVNYAERLLATHSSGLDRLILTCTGSEAIDLAIRIARKHTGREGVIVSQNAYHGNTQTGLEVSPSMGAEGQTNPAVRTIKLPTGTDLESAGIQFKQEVSLAIADLESQGYGVGAMMFDTIFASDGIMVDPAGFLKPAVDLVRASGGLFIADEVQPGFARTGARMWGYQRHEVAPDIAVMGKPMGNGMPIAGLVSRAQLLDRFGKDTRYFNTFGGNSVSVAAASATLDVIENEHLLRNSREVGDALKHGILSRFGAEPMFGAVRGTGLYLGVELRTFNGISASSLAAEIVNQMRERRVLISTTGAQGGVLKIRPPLVFTKENVDTFLDALDETLSSLESSSAFR